MDQLSQLAALLKQHNAITNEIAWLIGRPAELGHIGEYLAANIFEIELSASATSKSIDGYFADGPLAQRSVNIKWYGKWECLLDITPHALPDYYLVLAGPKSAAISSRHTTRPRVIHYVFLFDAAHLYARLIARKVKIGIATSVAQHLWQEAEIYPTQHNQTLLLTEAQRQWLALFAGGEPDQ
ncbi:MAG: hypothetical protein DCC55_29925 [Chloroflexi bacterium]|nr:MAG: hypothetical protein DCC55_29925 [Chloroflexota bacterium]